MVYDWTKINRAAIPPNQIGTCVMCWRETDSRAMLYVEYRMCEECYMRWDGRPMTRHERNEKALFTERVKLHKSLWNTIDVYMI